MMITEVEVNRECPVRCKSREVLGIALSPTCHIGLSLYCAVALLKHCWPRALKASCIEFQKKGRGGLPQAVLSIHKPNDFVYVVNVNTGVQ